MRSGRARHTPYHLHPASLFPLLQAAGPLSQQCDVVLDAIFGFSFKGDPRPPFDDILRVRVPQCMWMAAMRVPQCEWWPAHAALG